MSEVNERNRQDGAPEASENIEAKAAEAETVETKAVEAKEAPSKSGKAPSKKKKGKKKSKGRSFVIPLVVVLVAALVIFGALVGYGLGRVRGQREQEQQPEAQPSAAATQEPAYDGFTEALTQENQQALEVLSGADGEADANLNMLMGEDALLAGDDADQAAAPSAEPVVVAEYDGGKQVMSDEVMEAYNEELTMHILTGSTEEEVADTLLRDVLRETVSERVQEEHAKELGLYELNDDDRAEIEAQAASDYAEYVEFYEKNEINSEGMSDAEAEAAAKEQLLESEGVSYESIVAQLEAGRWEQKLFDYVTGDVTVDDAAVRAAYDARVAEQQASFTEYPEDYEFSQRSGDLVLYNLPGYRAVKLLLLGFEDEEAAETVYALTDELSMQDANIDDAERQRTLDACYAGPEARAKEALEQLRGGASMDDMILSIGQDEGMKVDRLRAQGYYFSEESSQPAELVAAAMALQNPGDFSEPVRTEDGVCILQYIGEVPEGAVPLEEVRGDLTEEVLISARNNAYNAQVRAWMSEANPSYYPERMQ